MKRREFLKALATGTVAAALGLAPKALADSGWTTLYREEFDPPLTPAGGPRGSIVDLLREYPRRAMSEVSARIEHQLMKGNAGPEDTVAIGLRADEIYEETLAASISQPLQRLVTTRVRMRRGHKLVYTYEDVV